MILLLRKRGMGYGVWREDYTLKYFFIAHSSPITLHPLQFELWLYYMEYVNTPK
jgi:hypothetical protein